jgi:hypothetical protein
MIFLPWEKLEYTLNMTNIDITKMLNNIIKPKNNILYKNYGSGHLFEGYFSNNKFRIKLLTLYSNPFSPVINGRYKEEENKTIININMRPYYFFLALIIISFVITLFTLTLLVIKYIKEINIEIFTVYQFLGIFFSYLLLIGAFKYDSIKSKNIFNKLFNKDNINNSNVITRL